MIETGYAYIYAPVCGTCALAEKMLEVALAVRPHVTVEKYNANVIRETLEKHQVMSVPALLKLENGVVTRRMYAFQNVQNVMEFFE